jgi:hypothetical protein
MKSRLVGLTTLRIVTVGLACLLLTAWTTVTLAEPGVRTTAERSSLARAGPSERSGSRDPVIVIEVVDGTPSGGDVGRHSSLTLDDQGRLAVAYEDTENGNLKFAVKDTAWAIETVDDEGSVGQFASLSIDADGRPNITYYDATRTAFKYAGWTEQSWSVETEIVDGTPSGGNVGEHSSLTLDDSGNLAVAYYDAGNFDVKYAVKDGTWAVEIVDAEGSVGQFASLSIDDLGQPSITYYDATQTALRYAGGLEQSWATAVEVVDGTPSGGNVGEYSSLTLDDAGNLAVAYYDRGNFDVKYAVKDGTWAVETVDDEGSVGQFASLSIDGLGQPSITYYDATQTALKYAGWLEQSWATDVEIVDGTPSGGNVGEYSSLTLDDQGRLAVAYYDAGNFDVKYAVKDGTWAVETVDDEGSVGQFASLSIDGLGQPSVTYYDATQTALKYAGWLEQSWSTDVEVVDGGDSRANVGEYSSLTLDETGRLAVAYYDRTNGDLKFALKDSTWAIEVVDDTDDVGQHPSLSIDTEGRPNVSYYDVTDTRLKYAGWLTPPVGVAEEEEPAADGSDTVPMAFAVFSPLPNPSAGAVAVAYDVPAPGYEVTATVYSAAGRVVSDVDVGWRAPGSYTFTWNGRQRSGSRVASGVYFCRITVGSWSDTRRVVLVR